MSESASYFKVERGSARNFGFVFAVVFLAIGLVPYAFGGSLYYWALVVAAVFAAVAAARPALLEPLNIVWFKFGMLLGAVIAPLVMMVVYFGVVTPTGLLMRLTGKDPLALKRKTDQKSYWISRKVEEGQRGTMKNQF